MKLIGLRIVGMLVAGLAAGQVPNPLQHGNSDIAKRANASLTSESLKDLQGIWTNATLTRLERPPGLEDRPTLTDEEARQLEKRDLDRGKDPPLGMPLILGNLLFEGANVGYNVLFIDRGSELARVDGRKRTSLIVDPPDGRIPPLTAEARRRNAAFLSRRRQLEGAGSRPLAERCIVDSTSGPPMLPVLYNNNYQFVQTKAYLMIMIEMVHDVRIIRINGTHKPAGIRQLLGDSVGHWEADTLVVDTTNFTDQTRFKGSSENLHVIERFRRVNDNTILYRATIDDPSTFERPWMIEYPFLAAHGPIFEYACHEGNYSLTNILNGTQKPDFHADKQ